MARRTGKIDVGWRATAAGGRHRSFGFGLPLSALLVALVLSLGLALPAPASAAYDYVAKWGSYGTGEGQFDYPRGIATDTDGSVYVADTSNQRIQKFDSEGTFLAEWRVAGVDLATDAAGDVYVVEVSAHRVRKFDSEGTFLTAWGGFGPGDGQFDRPMGIATDTAGNVYVVDSGNDRIQKFDSTGAFLAGWSARATLDVTIGAAGNAYATTPWGVQKFTSAGAFLDEWGSYGTGEGQFDYPLGIATDTDGNVYVADSGNGRIQKFDADGTFLAKGGSQGARAGQLYAPQGIAVDADGYVYIADTSNNRIQKFAEVPFDTEITSGPAGLTTDNTPSFGFSAGRAGPSFECRLDSEPFTPCTSPFTAAPLTDGDHSFYVRGRDDGVGYFDQSPAFRAFTVNTQVKSAYVRAKKSQPQKGRLIKVEVEAGANVRVTAKATGKVKVKGKRARAYKLGRQLKRVGPGWVKTFRLKPTKRKHHRKIFKALDKGKKVRAPIWVKLTDQAGNSVREKRVVRLK
jgi:DNA-binding beta-propeller fold protein YncE